VQRTKISPDFECQGQRSRSPGTKNEKVRRFVRESSSGARSSCGIFFGSGPRGRGYAGGKISACCLYATACSYRIVHVNIRQAFLISLDLFVNT